MMEAATYNYHAFRPQIYTKSGCAGPEPGTDLGGSAVFTVDGRQTTLREQLDQTTVIETGSTTCPLYCANIDDMRRLADAHTDVDFIVLYTREAHPGGQRGPHTDLDDKLSAARGLADDAGEWRRVLVDDLEGSLHARLSSSPDSAMIVDSTGTVIRWMNNADPMAVEQLLTGLADGRTPAPKTSFRPPPPVLAIRTLMRGGPRAVVEFLVGLPTLARYRLSGSGNC